jgi:hypothetical protein
VFRLRGSERASRDEREAQADAQTLEAIRRRRAELQEMLLIHQKLNEVKLDHLSTRGVVLQHRDDDVLNADDDVLNADDDVLNAEARLSAPPSQEVLLMCC